MISESKEPRFIQSLHKPRVSGFRWVSPQDDLDVRIYREILTSGCSILSFDSSATSPEFSYSVGLYLNFLQPEVLLMGVHQSTAHEIISKIRDDSILGAKITQDTVRNDLFSDNRPVRFRSVPQERYLDYLGRNCNLYFSLFLRDFTDFGFPVVQAIWPGKCGHFPDDPLCDPEYAAIHTLTKQP